MRYLGIDYGTKKVGLALSDEGGRMGFPHSVIPQGDALLKEVVEIAEREGVGAVVIGTSYNLEGGHNAVQKEIDTFVSELTAVLRAPVYRESEVFSTQEALRGQGRHAMTDASAAAIILNSFITRHQKQDS